MKSNWCEWLVLAWAAALPAAEVPAYTIQTVAGSSNMGDGGPATAAQIGSIQGVAVDAKGDLFLSDTNNHRVRRVDTTPSKPWPVVRTWAMADRPPRRRSAPFKAWPVRHRPC